MLAAHTSLAVALLATAGCATAQTPVCNILPDRHPNLAAARDLTIRAYDRLTAAQQQNDYFPGGHATRAKELLAQATVAMKEAALSANRR